MRMLAISGSLRARSSHTALLRAAAEQAPEVAEVSIYGGLADLPHFNLILTMAPYPLQSRTFAPNFRPQMPS